MTHPTMERWDRETTLVTQVVAGASLLAFLVYFRRGDLLLYGDAVAHINIARRVFDSRTPGLLQLGTVWLPLPHLLMIPFLISDSTWVTGIGGSIVSMCSYVLGAAGIFRLVRGILSFQGDASASPRIAAWLATVIYAANPNLIYLQTTAMTEPLYLALFIWTVVHFSEFTQSMEHARTEPQGGRSLIKCGVCLAGACLTRYDGWFLAVAVCAAALLVILRSTASSKSLRHAFAKFLLLAAAAPVLWLAYNAIIYHNPLEFADGPYSARAIERKSQTAGMQAHPGSHDLPVAFSYFLKSAELNMAEGGLQRVWVVLLVSGTILIFVLRHQFWPLVLLLTPLPFYMLSVAYGGVPIYIPVWWPFSYYNARYGLQLLPAFAALMGITLYFVFRGIGRMTKIVAAVVAVLLVTVSYASIWRSRPVCYHEAWVNSRTRIALETGLAATLIKLPPDSTLLMYLGDHVGALQRAGIHLSRTINEGNHRPWMRPSDPEGLWERALADPQKYADYVIAMEGDPVATEVQRRDLTSMVVIRALGQPAATIYWTHRPLR